MESYNIVNIQEIETFKKGESYKGEITVFTSDIGPKFLLSGNKSVYLLALSEFSIQQIATELHFSDQASFSKFFKRTLKVVRLMHMALEAA